ncbi:hypothetical protein LJK88_23000 [Paenibacillus sp. P26]|nr:hypothetical protein LJK88_23000 [Paenibacillus sp. P26]UUZ95604.1 hypothetical protein LJK87_14865 [Paenibacillus sp. P25]
MGRNRGLKQKLQSMRAESNQAVENIAGSTMPTYHKDKHAPNRPSI